MSIVIGPSVSLPRWSAQGKVILGWEFSDGFYCLECARAEGLGNDAGFPNNSPFSPIVQEDPLIVKVTPCSGCRKDLGKPFQSN